MDEAKDTRTFEYRSEKTRLNLEEVKNSLTGLAFVMLAKWGSHTSLEDLVPSMTPR